MKLKGLEIGGEIVKTEVQHLDAGEPPMRFIALRLTHQTIEGKQVTGPWQVLAVPLAQQFVESLRGSLDQPELPASPTTPLH